MATWPSIHFALHTSWTFNGDYEALTQPLCTVHSPSCSWMDSCPNRIFLSGSRRLDAQRSAHCTLSLSPHYPKHEVLDDVETVWLGLSTAADHRAQACVSLSPTHEITSPGSPWTLPSQPCFMLQFHLSPIHFVKVTFLILALFLCSCLVSPEYCTSFLCALLWWCSWYVFTISPVCALIGPLLVRCPLFFFFPTSYRVQHIFDGSEIHATFSKSF